MDQFPGRNEFAELKPVAEDDEIGTLSGQFRKLCERLEDSQQQ
jgi:hypothetical protein